MQACMRTTNLPIRWHRVQHVRVCFVLNFARLVQVQRRRGSTDSLLLGKWTKLLPRVSVPDNEACQCSLLITCMHVRLKKKYLLIFLFYWPNTHSNWAELLLLTYTHLITIQAITFSTFFLLVKIVEVNSSLHDEKEQSCTSSSLLHCYSLRNNQLFSDLLPLIQSWSCASWTWT